MSEVPLYPNISSSGNMPPPFSSRLGALPADAGLPPGPFPVHSTPEGAGHGCTGLGCEKHVPREPHTSAGSCYISKVVWAVCVRSTATWKAKRDPEAKRVSLQSFLRKDVSLGYVRLT